MIGDISPHAFASAMTSRPLAMAPDAAACAFDMLSAMDTRALAAGERAAASKHYDLAADGVATIRIHAQLVNRASPISDWLGFGAFDKVRAALSAAGADPAVRGVILEFDSPGGDVAGATETAAAVRALASCKPVVALVDSMAASAAYVVAAGAPRIVVTPSATVGSLGVAYLHLDRSAAMAKSGVKATLIHAGKFKVDGHRFAALPDDARARLTDMIGEAHTLILNSVGQHRPRLGAAGARKTEAGVYMGAAAVAAGLADVVGGLETARAYLLSPRPSSPPLAASRPLPPSPSNGVKPMSPSASFSGPSALAPLVAAPYQFQPDAVLRAVKKDQSRAKADALVARQSGGLSVDDQWRGVMATVSRKTSAALRPAPTAAKTPDDAWREVVEKLPRSSVSSQAGR